MGRETSDDYYPTKSEFRSRAKCEAEHKQLYEKGSTDLDTDISLEINESIGTISIFILRSICYPSYLSCFFDCPPLFTGRGRAAPTFQHSTSLSQTLFQIPPGFDGLRKHHKKPKSRKRKANEGMQAESGVSPLRDSSSGANTSSCGLLLKVLKSLYKARYDFKFYKKSTDEKLEQILAAVRGTSIKTKDTIIPGMKLPTSDSNFLKRVEEHLLTGVEARSDFKTFLVGLTSGKTKAVKVSNKIMGTLMNNYCAAYYVWDGVHKGSKAEGKLALKKSLPTLTECLEDVIQQACSSTMTSQSIKANAGRYLTLASGRLTDKDHPVILPWVYGQQLRPKETPAAL